MSTFHHVVDGLNLPRTFPEHSGSRATRPITERESMLCPPLKTVLVNQGWFDVLVKALRQEFGPRLLAPTTIARIQFMEMTESIAVTPYWTDEASQVEGFLNLLRTAALVVEDLMQFAPDSVLAGGSVSREACIPDLHARDRDDNMLLTVEAKTPDVLREEDWELITKNATSGGPWSEGAFGEDVSHHAGSMITQTWCQSVFATSENYNGETVTPRYCALTNYNETVLGLRGSGTGDENTLFLTEPLDRAKVFVGLVAILVEQIRMKTQHVIYKTRATASALFKLPNSREDHRQSELVNPTEDLDYFTYTYDIRRRSGLPFMRTEEPRTLRRGKRLPPGNQSSPDPSHHLTIIAHLGDGIVGEVYVARCGKHLLAWKEIDPAKEGAQRGESAWREAALYEGPLAPLQGTVVPRFYGAYRKTTDDHIVLLMQYVGPQLAADTWGQVAPSVRLAAEEQLSKVTAAGVAHGDFEPRNVCIDAGIVKIIDFSHATYTLPSG